MKKNNFEKTVIPIAVGVLMAILISITYIRIHGIIAMRQETQVKERILANASQNNYEAIFVDDKRFYIDEDKVKYYFDVEISGVRFDKCEFIVEEDNVKVKEGEIQIRIRNIENDKVNVGYHDSRVLLLDDGTEKSRSSTGYFISNAEFDENSLTIPNTLIPDIEYKVQSDYQMIMKFTTVDTLKECYSKGLKICEQLNK